jgi:hypothetical protein
VLFQFGCWGVDTRQQSLRGNVTKRWVPDSVRCPAQLNFGVTSTKAPANGKAKKPFLSTKGSLVPLRGFGVAMRGERRDVVTCHPKPAFKSGSIRNVRLHRRRPRGYRCFYTSGCRKAVFRARRPTLSVVPSTLIFMATRIDCDTCVVRGLACHDCVVTVLLGPPPELTIDEEEKRALDVLAEGGLVPPLRLVEPVSGPEVESA